MSWSSPDISGDAFDSARNIRMDPTPAQSSAAKALCAPFADVSCCCMNRLYRELRKLYNCGHKIFLSVGVGSQRRDFPCWGCLQSLFRRKKVHQVILTVDRTMRAPFENYT